MCEIPTHVTYDGFIFQVLSSIKADKGQANDGLSSALLLVHLDSAKNLPVNTQTHIHIYTHMHFLSFLFSSFLLNLVPPLLFYLALLLYFSSSSVSFCGPAVVSWRFGWRAFLRDRLAVSVWESAALLGWCFVRTLLPSTGQCLWVTLPASQLDFGVHYSF